MNKIVENYILFICKAAASISLLSLIGLLIMALSNSSDLTPFSFKNAITLTYTAFLGGFVFTLFAGTFIFLVLFLFFQNKFFIPATYIVGCLVMLLAFLMIHTLALLADDDCLASNCYKTSQFFMFLAFPIMPGILSLLYLPKIAKQHIQDL